MKKTGVGKAHSKIILMGEHAVVYGYPAIALPLRQIEVTCCITESEQPFEWIDGDTLSMALFAALEELGKESEQFTVTIDSQVPTRRGMGSSAAVSIAAVRAVYDYFKEPLEEETLEILVHRAETIAHQNPSGLDAKTCLSEQAIQFIRNNGFKTLQLHLGAYLLIADTGIYGRTSEAIAHVESQGKAALKELSSLGDLTLQVERAIASKDLSTIGLSMSQAHEHLRQLGVSCQASDCLVEEALRLGALGAKMSGGGLGGCIIALIQTREKAEQIARALIEKGAVNTWIENL